MTRASVAPDQLVGAELGGRFRIARRLGAGGFGTVYEAHDRRRGATIALKVLERRTPLAIAQIKREFRELADLVHPNLVRLDELHVDRDIYFFTMERVLGVDLRRWVGADPEAPEHSQAIAQDAVPTRAGADVAADADSAPRAQAAVAYDEARLRAALTQIVRGLDHLHRNGKLHCDVKPSNVVVELETGRAVLVDFGLVTEADRADALRSGAGTPRFMSPEMIAGEPLGPASDVYSLGVTLYEILTGTSPFEGTTAQLLSQKVFASAPPVSLRAPEAPADLAALCDAMLARSPRARPDAAAVLRALGEGEVGTAEPRTLPFVGREREIRTLVGAVQRAREAGRPTVIRAAGPSGIGKTRLLREACDAIARAFPSALVLRARCLEQEWLPYKALDPVIERLIAELAELDPARRAEIAPDAELAELGQVFTLARELIGGRTSRTSLSPVDRRRAAADALRTILARVASARPPLVLAIDDAQWGDEDSARMIAAAIGAATTPIALILASRAGDAGPFTTTLRASLEGTPAAIEELEIAPLAREDARRIALEIAPSPSGGTIERVLDAAEGNPFLLAEVARASAAGDEIARDADALLRARVGGLGGAARSAIETLAVAGRPLPRALLESVAGTEGDAALAAIATLRASRLATSRTDARGEWIEAAHDRVRESVYAGLATNRRRALHGSLATALEASPHADPETISFHCERAGRIADAIRHAETAGDAAMRALAFGRAAASYQRALALAPADGAQRARLLEALGLAHERTGRAVAAADALDRAAELAEGRARALELRRHAATLRLQAGHVEEGMRGIDAVLAEVGLVRPRSRLELIARMLVDRARLELGGFRFTPRPVAEIPEQELLRVDVCWSVATGMSLIDTAAGAYFSSLHVRQALACGEIGRIARAISSEVAYRAGTGGVGRSASEVRTLERARELAERAGDAEARARLRFVTGTACFLHAEWENARRELELAAEEMRTSGQALFHEIVTAEHFVLASLGWLGRWRELGERLPSVLDHARDVGDLYAETTIATAVGHYPALAADDPRGARAVLEDGMSRWSEDGFFIQHYDVMVSETDVDLYVGRAAEALARLEARWAGLERSLLRHVQAIRIESEHTRARAWIANGRAREARGAGKRLVREGLPWSIGLGELVLASCEPDDARAIAGLERAERSLEAASTALIAAAARWRRGERARDGALVASARARFEAQGVRAPDRIVSMIAPSLPRG